MDKLSVTRLQDIIDKRIIREKVAGGEVFAAWGFLILCSIVLQLFFQNKPWIGLAGLLLGIIFQITFVNIMSHKSGYKLLWDHVINSTWIFIVCLIVIINILFPYVFKLYDGIAGSALIFLFLSIGMFFSGVFANKWSLRFGGVVFVLAAICMPLSFIENKYIISFCGIFFGLFLPGIWCMIEERKS
jgi:hypothetical protein